MEIILIDAGNTTVDCRIYDTLKQEFKPFKRLLTPAWLLLNPLDCFSSFSSKPSTWLIYSSVVPKINDWLDQMPNYIKTFNIRHSNKINPDDFAFDIQYLGSDFISNFYAQSWTNIVIVNCGTASTISFIEQGKFQGTAIAPGWLVSLEAFLGNAALLKSFSPTSVQWTDKRVGQNTAEALSLGAINGHYLMLKNLALTNMPNTPIIFTGGNALALKSGWRKDHFDYQENLIFQGLINLTDYLWKD